MRTTLKALNAELSDRSELHQQTMNATETTEATRSVASEPSEAPVRSSDWLGRIIVFAIYSIIYEAIIWGIFGWAVFVNGRSGWWLLVAIFCSGAQLKPKHFGICEAKAP